MTYKAIIAEDNPVDAEVLQDYLNKYFPEITIAARVVSVAEIKKRFCSMCHKLCLWM